MSDDTDFPDLIGCGCGCGCLILSASVGVALVLLAAGVGWSIVEGTFHLFW